MLVSIQSFPVNCHPERSEGSKILRFFAVLASLRRRKGEKIFYVLEAMMEVEENGSKDFRKIRVILIEDKQKSKIFYSVMDKKQKEKKVQKSGTPHA